MAIYILHDGADFPDANALQEILNRASGVNGPAKSIMIPQRPLPTPVDNDAVIVIWSDISRGNTALTTAAAEMADTDRLIQVAATGQSSLPGVIPIADTSAIVTTLQQPPFVVSAETPDRWVSDLRIIIIMAIIIAVVLLLIWIAPSDDHLYADCRTSYTADGYPIEHCEDSYY